MRWFYTSRTDTPQATPTKEEAKEIRREHNKLSDQKNEIIASGNMHKLLWQLLQIFSKTLYLPGRSEMTLYSHTLSSYHINSLHGHLYLCMEVIFT